MTIPRRPSCQSNPAKIRSLDALVKHVREIEELGGEAFVRWSRGQAFDNRESFNFVTGQTEAGLSVNGPLPQENIELLIAEIQEYEFLRMKDSQIRPWLVSGTIVGRGGDNEPLLEIGTVTFLGEIATEIFKESSERVFSGLMPIEAELAMAARRRLGLNRSLEVRREAKKLSIHEAAAFLKLVHEGAFPDTSLERIAPITRIDAVTAYPRIMDFIARQHGK